MESLSYETKSLLDRLYNLRGSNSVFLKQNEEERKNVLEKNDNASMLKSELEDTVKKCENELEMLHVQGDKLKEDVLRICNDDFSFVLDKLKLDFDPNNLREKLESSLPVSIDNLKLEKKEASDKLNSTIEEINSNMAKLSELENYKKDMLGYQEILNKYLDMALNGNINVTRDEITDLLVKFGFNEYETKEVAKLLMFPEDGLTQYDKMQNDVILSNDDKNESDSLVQSNQVFFEDTEEKININANEPLTSDTIVVEEINQEKENITKDKLIEILTANGFDYLDFTANDFDKMINNYNKQLFENNVKLIKNLGISLDIFVDNITLFSDDELSKKVEKLISVGKEPKDLYLNPYVLIKYKYDELMEAISLLTSNGLDPKSVPLMAF